jgi:predicted O-methyltransferase YrrM
MPDTTDADRLNSYLLDVYGADPFAAVYEASEAHRRQHAAMLPGGEQECGVYTSDPLKMRLLATLARAVGPRRSLEIGGGLGRSALWLADAMGMAGQLETIDRFAEHVELIERFAEQYDLAGRIVAIHGEAEDVLKSLTGPYDLIYDDGWFGEQPAYYDRMVELLRPGGLMIMSNWFLLEQAFRESPDVDWAQFAGPHWRDKVRAYAEALASDSRLQVSFNIRPAWVCLGYKRADA